MKWSRVLKLSTAGLLGWVIPFDLDKKNSDIKQIENKMLSPLFWDDQKTATNLINAMNQLKSITERYAQLILKIQHFQDEILLLKEEYSAEMHQLLEEEYKAIYKQVNHYEMDVLLTDEYDRLNAIIEIHPGAGGVESQDWAEMLYRMYVRYAESNDLKIETLDYQTAEEAGIKSVSFILKGPNIYGYLKGEKGVHRLVRISPFDAASRRHTSFASVDVMPEITDNVDVEIQEKDLKIDTFRASGAGGQHINKTDSAVRMTHLPTGIVVNCQSERSQIQNRERAMQLLKTKLYQRKIEETRRQMAAIRGEVKSIEWGSQIRSYVFCPYTLVKDHRSGYETGDVFKVMNGDLGEIIYANMKAGIK